MSYTTYTMIENIKTLYQQIDDRRAVVVSIAEEFGLKPISVANNWFGSYWAIPDRHQERVAEILQNAIRIQNENTSAA